MKFSRRDVFKMLAATGAMASLPVFHSSRLMAAPGDVPLRILFVNLASGLLKTAWEPTGSGGVPATEQDWNLPSIWDPLKPFQSRMNLFKNLDMVSVKYDKTPPSNAHASGRTHYMTADYRKPGFGTLSSGVSVDQWIAKQINGTTPVTRLSSLQIGNLLERSWLGNGMPVDYISDPEKAHAYAFGQLELTPEQAAENSLKSTFIQSRHTALMKRLGAQDRAVIQSQLDLHADLARRAGIKGNAQHAMSIAEFDMLLANGGGSRKNWSEYNDLNIALATSALYSDTTRVLNLGITTPTNSDFNYTSGQFGSSNWHDLDHKVSGAVRKPDEANPIYGKGGDGYDRITKMQNLQLQKLADLLRSLEACVETDGSTLLDNTLVVCTSHISDGSHSTSDLPWFTIGGAQGFFKTGRYFELARQPYPNPANWQKDHTVGTAHNDLFLSLIQAMRVDSPVDAKGNAYFGMKEASKGPILQMHM